MKMPSSYKWRGILELEFVLEAEARMAHGLINFEDAETMGRDLQGKIK